MHLQRIRRISSAVSVAPVLLLLLSSFSHGSIGERVTCSDGEISNCVKSFEPYFAKGVIVLANKDDEIVLSICRKYEEASNCLAIYIYYCHKMLRHLREQLTAFEYACNAVERKGQWPFLSGKGDRELNPADELFNSDDKSSVLDSAIKASVAAGVTFILIMMCVVADCISRCRISQKVKRAVDATKAEQWTLKAVIVDDDDDGHDDSWQSKHQREPI